jgi:hypothetical protein
LIKERLTEQVGHIYDLQKESKSSFDVSGETYFKLARRDIPFEGASE